MEKQSAEEMKKILDNISQMSNKLFEYANAAITDIDILEKVYLEIASTYLVGSIDFSQEEDEIQKQLSEHLAIVTEAAIVKTIAINLGDVPDTAKKYTSVKNKKVDDKD